MLKQESSLILFEMRTGMNEFDYRILLPEKFAAALISSHKMQQSNSFIQLSFYLPNKFKSLSNTFIFMYGINNGLSYICNLKIEQIASIKHQYNITQA